MNAQIKERPAKVAVATLAIASLLVSTAVDFVEQLVTDLLHHAPPIVSFVLAIQTQRRIPRTIGSVGHPDPIRVFAKHHPRRHAQRAREVSDRRAAGDDEVHLQQRSGSDQQSALPELRTEIANKIMRTKTFNVSLPSSDLQPVQPNMRVLGEPQHQLQRNRTFSIAVLRRIAGPADADTKRVGPQR